MILITGAARSGTSLTTQVLQACGANLGRINSLFENTAVRDGICKPYLRHIGADPLGQHPLPDVSKICPTPDEAAEWRDIVFKAMGKPAEPWAYKGAKICLIWPLWAAAFPDARWVIVRRDAQHIARSCERTPFMRAFGKAETWMPWVWHHEARLAEMMAQLDHVEVWPHEAVKQDIDAFRPVAEFCGLEWNRDAAARAIDPRKWHAH